MRIPQNLAVHGHEGRVENTSRRDDNLVRGVAVELAWKLSGLDADAARKLDEPDSGISERLPKPVEYGTRQSKPPAFDELGDLLARNRAHGDAGLLGRIKERTGGRRECRVAVNPPDPDVRIEDNHPAAAQSASATGSVGERSVTGVPRSGWRERDATTAANGRTMTSTDSPRRKGMPRKVMTPSSARVVSARWACMVGEQGSLDSGASKQDA